MAYNLQATVGDCSPVYRVNVADMCFEALFLKSALISVTHNARRHDTAHSHSQLTTTASDKRNK